MSRIKLFTWIGLMALCAPYGLPYPKSVPDGQDTTAARAIAEIPIETVANKTILPVTVGGRKLRLILDTGQATDGILIFHSDKIDPETLGPSASAAIEGAGSGPGSRAFLFERASFEVGKIPFTNQRAIVLADDSFKGFRTDGVIGYSLLGHYAVEIDYDRSVMRLHDPARFVAQPGWESLPIYFKNNRIPWLDITIVTRDETPARLAAYIDFASSEALELLTRDANKFTLPADTKERYLGRGLSGDIHGREGTISRMRIGSHELTQVVVAIAPAAVRSKQEGADAVVGNNALRRFNVIFDYANRKLHIRPNSHFQEPFEKLDTIQGRHGAQSRDEIDRMRDKELQPDRVMDVIGLRPGMTVGEAGASYGYFTFKMSRRVGSTGTVYANDIDAGALASIRKRAESEKVANITTVLGEVVDPRFPRNDLDMIVVFECLFEFSEQAGWIKSARRYLKPGGSLVIVDPDKSKISSEHFLTRQQVAGFGQDAGYRVVTVDDTFLKTHMIVVLQPPAPPASPTPGERLREQGDIPGAIAEFEKAYLENPNDAKNLYNLAASLSINRQLDPCYKYLTLAVGLNPSIQVLIDPDLLTARADKSWGEFEDKLIATLNPKLNQPFKDVEYAKALWRMSAWDQAFFTEIGIAGRKIGMKSSVVEALWKFKFMVQERNEQELERLIDKKGWPRVGSVGREAAMAAYLVTMHSHTGMQKKYLATIKTICEAKELPWERYALIYDRSLVNENKPQRFGTHTKYNEQTKAEELYPLEDETKVNEWRRELGLQPLEEYLKQFNITFQPVKK